MNAALLMVRSLLSLPDRLDLHVTATYSGHRSRAHQEWRTGPRLGSTLCRVREFNRLGPVLDEVWAVNGGEALANGEEVRIAGVGTFGTRSRPARTGRNPMGRRGGFDIGVGMSPSLRAGKAVRDALNAGSRSWPSAGRRFRPGTPRILPIWKPADYDTMTDPPGLTAPLPGNPNVAAGLRAWLRPAWIRDCI